MGGLGLGMTLGSAVVVINNVWWRFTVRRWRYGSDLLINVARSLSKFEKIIKLSVMLRPVPADSCNKSTPHGVISLLPLISSGKDAGISHYKKVEINRAPPHSTTAYIIKSNKVAYIYGADI